MPIINVAPGVVAYSASGNANATTVGGSNTTPYLFPQSIPNTQCPTGTAAAVKAPGSGRLEGRIFYISASGTVTTGASTITVTPAIYAIAGAMPTLASQLIAASYTALATPTGVSIAAASTVPWLIELEVMGDSTSGKLHGTMRTYINNTLTGPVALTNVLPSVSFTADPAAFFVPAMTFSVSNAANSAQLDAFYVSAD